MQKLSFVAALVLGSATAIGTSYLFGGGPAIPMAMAQGAACCPTPAPVTQTLLDGPKFAPKDPARDADSSSAAAVCATPAMATGGYRTIMVQSAACHHPLIPEFSSGQAGFVSQVAPAMPCATANTPGARGSVTMIDATQGASFRLTTAPDAKGACPTDLKVTIIGVR